MICIDCGIDKSLRDYALSKKTRIGRAQPCKACFNLRAHQRYRALHPIPPPYEKPLTLICNECGIEQPLAAFTVCSARKSGHTQPCKVCHAAKHRLNNALDPIQTKAHKNAWNTAHPEKARQRATKWAKAYPNKVALNRQRRRARKRNLPDTFTLEEQAFMLNYWCHACAFCGNQAGFFWILALDHFIPLTSPACPGTVATNILPLCHGQGGCNNLKHNTEPEQWLRQRFGPQRAASILKKITTYFLLCVAKQAC